MNGSMETDKRTMPIIVDTTLRDGLQMPGISLTFSQKAAVLRRLHDLGITEAEIGCPATGLHIADEIGILSGLHSDIRCSAWCRARHEDISAAGTAGVSTIHISFPVSERHMRINSLSPGTVLSLVPELTRHALNSAEQVTIGAQDATRADRNFLKLFVAAAMEAGAKRIRIADTVGIATPSTAVSLIHFLHTTCPGARLEYHGHNDFGLAAAVTLAVMEAGIDAVSVTALGIGERAGNAALEEVISAAIMLYGFTTDLHLEHLSPLCQAVASFLSTGVRPNKAVCGVNAFRHESGIHCHGMLRDKMAYQAIAPETIGQTARYSIGVQSGSSSVQAALKAIGIPVDRSTSRALWEKYRGEIV